MYTEMNAEKNNNDYIMALIAIMGFCSLWTYAAAVWIYLGQPIPSYIFNKILVILGCLLSPVVIRLAHMNREDLGLSFRGRWKYIFLDAAATLLIVLLMIIIKLLILKVKPDYSFYTDGGFFQWNKYSMTRHAAYLLSVFGQEFLSRGVLHEALSRVIPNDDHEWLSICVSSLIFGALHIHLGLIYMLSAALLLALFGIIYRKQRTIWGLCIPHFVLGQALGILGFVVA